MGIGDTISPVSREPVNYSDLNGMGAKIVREKTDVKLAPRQFKSRARGEFVLGRVIKQNVSLNRVEQGRLKVPSLGSAWQAIATQRGIATNDARHITDFSHKSRFKVFTTVQNAKYGTTGKRRHEPKPVIIAARAIFQIGGLVNFRD